MPLHFQPTNDTTANKKDTILSHKKINHNRRTSRKSHRKQTPSKSRKNSLKVSTEIIEQPNHLKIKSMSNLNITADNKKHIILSHKKISHNRRTSRKLHRKLSPLKSRKNSLNVPTVPEVREQPTNLKINTRHAFVSNIST